MATSAEAHTPATNLRGLRDHWRRDIIAGLSVALVALPLSLGIAMAGGAPPISGVFSAILAGALTTFLRGSHVAINGPGNSLIVILSTAFAAFGGGPGAFAHVLGAVVVTGAIQVLIGLLRVGKLAQATPAAVIQGLLSAIGVIIVGKQLHVVLGRSATELTPVQAFVELPQAVAGMNPVVALIGVISLALLVVHPRIESRFVQAVPAPLWVVLLAVPLVELFNFLRPHSIELLGHAYHVGPEMLVSIPDDLLASMVRPDFSRITDAAFWGVVALITLVTSIENVVSVKAVDKLDEHGRRSDLDRDLMGVGATTAVAGMVGALPVLTVIARSSVNVNHGAQTGWSNFFHGAFLLVFIALLSPWIQEIPLAALAAILVYTGYRLAAPKVVKGILAKGPDHFTIFGITLVTTLLWGLLWGVLAGAVAELVSQLIVLRLPLRDSLGFMWRTRFKAAREQGPATRLEVDGVANFVNALRLWTALHEASESKHVAVDFSGALLVDTTLLEHCRDFGHRHRRADPERRFDVLGLEAHHALSDHPDALHVLSHARGASRLSARQRRLRELARRRGWDFEARRDWHPRELYDFQVFRAYPLAYRDTTVEGELDVDGERVRWRLCDVTFEAGAPMPRTYRTTALVLRPPVDVPRFVFLKKPPPVSLPLPAGFHEIRPDVAPARMRRFTLRGADPPAVRALMTERVLNFLEAEEPYRIESDGQALLIFKSLRPATIPEIERLLEFGENLIERLLEKGDGPKNRKRA